MPAYKQEDRPLKITTPLGEDILLLKGFEGREDISRLFNFQASLIADLNEEVRFDKIIGQSVTMEMRLLDGSKRYFNGIVKEFSQGRRDEHFLHFQAEIVPRLWLLTKKVGSRIFQHLGIPDILKHVLAGFDVHYELTGTYHPRDYCVQYRESDFDFVSRLMEEEGIYYFFNHSDGNHELVITDSTGKHPPVPGQTNVIYEEMSGEVRTDMRILSWKKKQRIRSGECTLWDHCFELPGNHLEAKEKTIDSVPVGKVTHKFNLANQQLEIYDYPGRYAQRFDGTQPAGGDRPADIHHIFEDRTRTVRLRMEQEEVLGIRIDGKSDCGHFTAGHKFTLERHFDADASYLLTRVKHSAWDESYRSDEPDADAFRYKNRFTCIPEALRFRPRQKTPKPVIAGVQTATVVGPHKEDIFVDKYGRVKVQFHWDREGKLNADSSCWIRVSQVWAGKGWGAFFWPRIGHEVVVSFEEGDPDQPLIVGSVYNAENMPWHRLPMNKELSGIKSESVRGTANKNYNAVIFNDEKGKEHVSIHSEHNLSLNSEDDKMIHAGRHKGERVAVANVLTVGKIVPVSGGGSGGASYEEGNPMPHPPPAGVVGLNSMFVYGDNFQGASPLNYQLAIGNNIQLCINPVGLMAGAPNAHSTEMQLMQAVAGSGMGGSMQFTIGTNAQFTLGQSYEISIGPPKIEIHALYKQHLSVSLACGLLGLFSVLYMVGYDLMKGKNNSKAYDAVDATEATKDAATAGEQIGDDKRATLTILYQMLTDVTLVAILALEAAADKTDWLADDTMKDMYKLDQKAAKLWGASGVCDDPKDDPWSQTGVGVVGAIGVGAALIAEMILVENQ